MKLSRMLACLTIACSCASTARAEITPAARAVVDRYLEATGGRAAFESTHSLHTLATISALGLKGTSHTWTRDPNWRATETELGPLKFREGYDGETAWRTDPSTGKVVVLDGKDLEDAKSSAYFEADRWLAKDQDGGKVTVVREEKDSTGRYTVLEVVPPIGRSRTYWFDQKTGLIARGETRKDQLEIHSFLSDYRKHGARLYPHHLLTQIVGMPTNDLDVVIDSVWVNETIADEHFKAPTAQPAAPRYLKDPGVAKLGFRYSARHVWLTAAVNGGEPADFIYDTGASITVIDSAYAAKIGLQTEGKMQGIGAGASGGAAFSKLQSLRVAGADGDGIEVSDVKVAVLSVNTVLAPFFWRDCAGIIGYDFISRFVNEIDFDSETLTLRDPKTFQYSGAGKAIPFTLAGTIPAIHLKLDGRYEGDFRVDVGSGSTVDLHAPFVKKHDLASKMGKSVETYGGGFGGIFREQVTRMQRIDVGPFGWDRPIVSLSGAETGGFASEDYAGNIGNQILQRFRLTLDYEHRQIYLEPSKRYAEPDRFSRVGMLLGRYGDTVKAMQVLRGSPAEKAGLEQGDEVVAIDGKPATSLPPDDQVKLFDESPEGREIAITVTRDGKKKDLKMKLKEML
jgi:hypothetical protein